MLLPLLKIVNLGLFISQFFVQFDIQQLPLLLFFHCFLHQANLHQDLLVGGLDVFLFVLEEFDLALELFDFLLILLAIFLFLYFAFHLFHLLLQLAVLALQFLVRFLLLFHFEVQLVEVALLHDLLLYLLPQLSSELLDYLLSRSFSHPILNLGVNLIE